MLYSLCACRNKLKKKNELCACYLDNALISVYILINFLLLSALRLSLNTNNFFSSFHISFEKKIINK